MKQIILFIAVLFITSCEKAVINENKSNDPVATFNQAWQIVDEKFSLFEFTNVNWNSIKTIYKGKVNINMSQDALYDTLSNMLFELKDGHTSIYKRNNTPNKFYEGHYTPFPLNYDAQKVRNIYINVNNPVSVHSNYKYCWIDNSAKIAYMNFDGNFDSRTSENDFVNMLNYFADCKGLIIDLRNNDGGNYSVAEMMLSHFTDKKILNYKEKLKNGKGHSDFTGWVDRYLEPAQPYFNKKIMILTNRKMFSTSELFVITTKSISNMKLVGDKTGGGIGVPTFQYLNNGWMIRTSSSVIARPDGSIFPNGTEPDYLVAATYANNKDEIIEKAIELLR